MTSTKCHCDKGHKAPYAVLPFVTLVVVTILPHVRMI